jgi:hypothetical protein
MPMNKVVTPPGGVATTGLASTIPGPTDTGHNMPRRSQWRDVDLRQADLRGATASVLFQDADFRNAKFQRTDFGWSDLVNCRFAGVVLGLTIGHRPITEQPPRWLSSGVDFTAATPRRLELIGVNLDVADIRFPADAGHWLVSGWPDYLQRLAAAIAVLPQGTVKLTLRSGLTTRSEIKVRVR